MGREIKYEVIIDMPREKAWEIMKDISVPHKYVPGLIKTEVYPGPTQGVGASRRVFKKFMALDETVTEWDEGYGFAIRLHDGLKEKPLPKAYFKYRIEDTPEGKTRFIATMGYTFPFGVLGQLIDSLLVAPIVSGEVRAVALAVKHFYETGTTPTSADIRRLKSIA